MMKVIKKAYIPPQTETLTAETEGMLAVSVLDELLVDPTQGAISVDPTQEWFNGDVLTPSFSDDDLTDMVFGM
jgi:hypothetical protein